MNKIKDSFLIQDLENLSGIKAHTIRIWEKRYALLTPTRLNRNIRKYSLLDLQKLLNVSVLYNNGFKISKLSELSDKELFDEARTVSTVDISSNYFVNSLILTMYSFDSLSFEKTYQELSSKMSFKELFIDVYIPLLHHIGVLWQTDAIKPAHEHFISNLIVQKIVLNTATIKTIPIKTDETYVLFLPEGELHSLGLLFLNYCLKLKGENTVYLGGGLPFLNLDTINAKFDKIHWVCFFIIDKTSEEKLEFLGKFNKLLQGTKGSCSIIGHIWKDIANSNDLIKLYPSFKNLPFF
jgi:DNA-binding transcriptional MerR regulator